MNAASGLVTSALACHHCLPCLTVPLLPPPSTSTSPCQVMPSLQRPKRITFIGSDGREYSFLAKPKDDLRKDYRWVGRGCYIT